MKYVFLAALLYIAYLLGRRFIRRKLRGESAPEPAGPRTITLIAMAIILVYGVLLVIRMFGYAAP